MAEHPNLWGMPVMQPLVSVYLPTHNRIDLLPRAIESVMQQTYKNIELLIIDDGSSDGTAEFLAALPLRHFPIRVITQSSPQGACIARNHAIEQAKGSFVTGLDDDDEMLPGRISELVKGYDPRFAFVCTGFLWHYGKRTRKVDHEPMTISLSAQLDYNFATNQILVERHRILEIGGFDPAFKACQDYDTWTRLIKRFGPAKRIGGATYIIHRGEDIQRISASANWLAGHQQFMQKHAEDMSNNNLLNQKFRILIASRQRMSLSMLFAQWRAGLLKQKLRYFLSSNLSWLARIRRQFVGQRD